MVASPLQLARRTFVSLLLQLARQYGVVLAITRDSPDKLVLDGSRKVVRKVHPDKGGSPDDAKKLNAARDAWDKALGAKTAPWQDPAKGAIGKPSTFETELETKAFTESFRHSPAKEKHVILMNPYFQPDPV